MSTQRFSISEALGFGWETTKKNFWFLLGLLLITGILFGVLRRLEVSLAAKSLLYSGIVFLVEVILGVIFELGWFKIILKLCDGQKAQYSEVFSVLPLFFKYLFAFTLYGMMITVGTMALIIPGVILGVRFQFFPYFIVEKEAGVIESLKQSFAITQGVTGQVLLFDLLLILLQILGALLLGVGLFFTIPTGLVALAFVYRKLLPQENIQVNTETYP